MSVGGVLIFDIAINLLKSQMTTLESHADKRIDRSPKG
jgi:hypothetical protein